MKKYKFIDETTMPERSGDTVLYNNKVHLNPSEIVLNDLGYMYDYTETSEPSVEWYQLTVPYYEIVNNTIYKKYKIVTNTINYIKDVVLKKIEEYDTSEMVNSFFINTTKMWLSKYDRTNLNYSVNIVKQNNVQHMSFWAVNKINRDLEKLELLVDDVLTILSKLEIYAMACFNVTQEHKLKVNSLTSVEDIINYDYTTGYPQKLYFAITDLNENYESFNKNYEL